jgi:hypothetical protein
VLAGIGGVNTLIRAGESASRQPHLGNQAMTGLRRGIMEQTHLGAAPAW